MQSLDGVRGSDRLQWLGGKRVKVNSLSLASSRLSAAARHFRRYGRRSSFRGASMTSNVGSMSFRPARAEAEEAAPPPRIAIMSARLFRARGPIVACSNIGSSLCRWRRNPASMTTPPADTLHLAGSIAVSAGRNGDPTNRGSQIARNSNRAASMVSVAGTRRVPQGAPSFNGHCDHIFLDQPDGRCDHIRRSVEEPGRGCDHISYSLIFRSGCSGACQARRGCSSCAKGADFRPARKSDF